MIYIETFKNYREGIEEPATSDYINNNIQAFKIFNSLIFLKDHLYLL